MWLTVYFVGRHVPDIYIYIYNQIFNIKRPHKHLNKKKKNHVKPKTKLEKLI